jgi:dihydroxy-acid dehydratase
VRDGDRIRLSASQKRIDLLVPPEELAKRQPKVTVKAPPERGYARLYRDSVEPAPQGCDFDFLKPQPPTRTSAR